MGRERRVVNGQSVKNNEEDEEDEEEEDEGDDEDGCGRAPMDDGRWMMDDDEDDDASVCPRVRQRGARVGRSVWDVALVRHGTERNEPGASERTSSSSSRVVY